jgi:hypothetical protein
VDEELLAVIEVAVTSPLLSSVPAMITVCPGLSCASVPDLVTLITVEPLVVTV